MPRRPRPRPRPSRLYRILSEAGDPQLAAELDTGDHFRLESQAPLGPALAELGVLRDGDQLGRGDGSRLSS